MFLLMEVVKRKLGFWRVALNTEIGMGNERETECLALPNSSHLASSPLRAVYNLQSNINLQGPLRRRSKGDSMIDSLALWWPAPPMRFEGEAERHRGQAVAIAELSGVRCRIARVAILPEQSKVLKSWRR